MLAQAPRIRFLTDFPSKSVLKDGGKLRWVNATQAMSYLGGWRCYS